MEALEEVKVGFALRNFSGLTGVSRAVLELARRLPARGFSPLLFGHRLPAVPAPAVARVPMLALSSWTRAASFDWFSRRRLAAGGARLVHGQGDLIRQDVVTVNNCDLAAARFVPDGRTQSAGVRYARDKSLAPGGAELVIALSALVAEGLQEFYGVAPEKIRRVTPGVDLERFHPRRRAAARAALLSRTGWGADRRVVLAAVSGDPAKRNLGLLFRAVEALPPKTCLCLVGKVDLSADESARRLQASGRLSAAGAVAGVEDYFAAADVFALPAHYEEFGLTVLEALASGTPVAVGRRVGAAEILTDPAAGRVVDDVFSRDAVAEALAGLLEKGDPAAARRQAQAHGWDRCADRHAEIYRELLARR